MEKLVIVDISPVTVSPSLSTMPKYFDAMMSVKLDGNIPLSKARRMADEQLTKYVSVGCSGSCYATVILYHICISSAGESIMLIESNNSTIFTVLRTVLKCSYQEKSHINDVFFLFNKDSGTRQFFLTNLVEAEGGHYKWRINLDSITRNFNNIATFPSVSTSCPVPTLFIAGANSDYVRLVYGLVIKILYSLMSLRLQKMKCNNCSGIELNRDKYQTVC